jgi:putative endonuclease
MATTVYMLRGSSGRYYLGCTDNLPGRLGQHQRGHTHTTLRLGLPLELIASREFPTRAEALRLERQLKSWKNPDKARAFLTGTTG